MFRDAKDTFINLVTSRIFVLISLFLLLFIIIWIRLFNLQIVKGASYLENFTLMIQKDKSIPASRGMIFDRNGELLAYNELAYSVNIEDVYESGTDKNNVVNNIIYELIKIIESNNDAIVSDFEIILNENNEFEFAVTETTKYRFLADVYGYQTIDELKENFSEYTASAEDVMLYLAGTKKYEIGSYTTEDDLEKFIVGYGYSNKELLEIVTIRYAMSKNSYQKFISTTVATDVSESTVATVLENSQRLEGVSIAEDTVRKYVDSFYFSHIIGYTSSISQEELTTANALSENVDNQYTLNDSYGKSGIEKVMESQLRGVNGSEIVHVDKLGTTIDTSDYIEPVAGNDLYLTIDKELQIATYQILEQKVAGILLAQIVNVKEANFSDLMNNSNNISIDEVYFALFNNNVLSIASMYADDASEVEQTIASSIDSYKLAIIDQLTEELLQTSTPYNQLTAELQTYETYLESVITDLFFTEKLDKTDEYYINWAINETISLKEYLLYAIGQNWVDISGLNLDQKYLDKEELYSYLIDYSTEFLWNDTQFTKLTLQYMIRNNSLSGKDICLALWEQDMIQLSSEDVSKLKLNQISAFQFMCDRIENLEITPAQLALDPCSASCVITDPNNGDVLALVSYPSYDNNRMSDATYYQQLNNDLSKPLWNYATQQKSAPGSTFKMVSSAAILEEHQLSVNDTVNCLGIFDKITPSINCWIYPNGTHGAMNVVDALTNSCNYYYYENLYNMCLVGNKYISDIGIDILTEYATMFGLDQTSGIEIMESVPQVSNDYAVPSSIGQGNHNYTTVGLARYVTAIANKGIAYDLTLLDYVKDRNNDIVEEFSADVHNIITFNPSTWDAIFEGMRGVIERKSYFVDFGIEVAGKTGTAQENLNRPDHSLFVGFAPYNNPEIAVATRIAFGSSSEYACEATKDVLSYYFDLENAEDLLSGTSIAPESSIYSSED